MMDGRQIGRFLAVGALGLALSAGSGDDAGAQEWVYKGSSAAVPTIEEYAEEIGPVATIVGHGQLTIDGRAVNCGTRPTVLNPNFDSWGGAFPGFLILNTKKIGGLSTQVKLYIYSHECGHQFIGADETKADLFAIRRGVKWGWLDAQGMEEICVFISQLKGDAVHPPGPRRCETMRAYYRQLLGSGTQQAGSNAQVRTLGPSN